MQCNGEDGCTLLQNLHILRQTREAFAATGVLIMFSIFLSKSNILGLCLHSRQSERPTFLFPTREQVVHHNDLQSATCVFEFMTILVCIRPCDYGKHEMSRYAVECRIIFDRLRDAQPVKVSKSVGAYGSVCGKLGRLNIKKHSRFQGLQ